MRRILLAVIPLFLVFLTFYLIKPSDDRCREVAVKRLATINVKASPEDILVKDHVVVKTLKYITKGDTLYLGTAALFRIKVNDRKLEKVSSHIKGQVHGKAAE